MIEKAVLESDLGIPPIVDGKMIRLAVPPLTRERREELAKIVKKQAEDGHVVLRSLRREANEKIKVLEKEKKITEDESFKAQAEIQKLTDRYVQLIDQAQASKEKELTQG
jgi:ribosome recycling factor